MSYDVQILADSVSPDGVRLTTMKATYPRFIHSELMTHRVFSRNAASSRAIPTEKNIARVRENPFVPETFNARVKGMGVGEALEDQDSARTHWLGAAHAATVAAEALNALDVDKSRANRLLEPFLWMTTIISATEWANFFALRDHPAAQPEFQITARLMREAIEASDPEMFDYGMWHMPLIQSCEIIDTDGIASPEDMTAVDWEKWKMISAGRCARVSYDTHENFEPIEKSIERAKILMGNGHFSPFEHVARPAGGSEPHPPEQNFFGNFRGWVQMRTEIPFEDRFDLALKAQS